MITDLFLVINILNLSFIILYNFIQIIIKEKGTISQEMIPYFRIFFVENF